MRILSISLILSALLISSVPATPGMANSLTLARTLPEDNLYPDDIFHVMIQFTAPDDNFNAIGITDIAPDGWGVSVNTVWCTPEATLSSSPKTDTAGYVWLSSFSAGTVFTVVYEVTVPTVTTPGTYIFPGGYVEYYLSGDGPYYADIMGDTEVIVVNTCTLIVNTIGIGSVGLSPAGGSYASGIVVELTSTADSGWNFSAWSGNLSGSTNPTNVTMDGNKTVTATFTQVTSSGNSGGGGVGGSSATTNLNEYSDSDGKFMANATAESNDGLVKIQIPEGTIAKNRIGQRLRYVSIKEKNASPSPTDSEFVSLAYDIGPNASIFDPPIYLTLVYDDTNVPLGVAEENLVIGTWQDNEWVILDGCVVDPVENTVTAPINHFTIFTVIAYTTPAKIIINGITVTPAEVYPEEGVTVSVTVTNTGDLTGSYDVTLKINDLVLQTRKVTLDGGKSKLISFTVTAAAPGEYTVSINGLQSKFTVKEPEPEGTVAEVTAPEPPTPSPTPTLQPTEKPLTPPPAEEKPAIVSPVESVPPSSSNWGLIVLYVVAGVIVIGLVTLYFIRRRGT